MECNVLAVQLVDGELTLVFNEELLEVLGIDISTLNVEKIGQLATELIQTVIA